MGARDDFVPALGFSALTRHYDRLIALTFGDRLLRRGMVADISAALADSASDEPAVVELGCGTGSLTLALADALPAVRFSGVEIDPAMLGRAQGKSGADRVEWIEGSIDALPLDDRSVDAVAISLVMHHLSPGQQPRALAEAWRVLRPGGTLHILDFGRPRGLMARVGSPLIALLDGRENTAPIFRGELMSMIPAAGFTNHCVRHRTNTPVGTLERHSARRPE